MRPSSASGTFSPHAGRRNSRESETAGIQHAALAQWDGLAPAERIQLDFVDAIPPAFPSPRVNGGEGGAAAQDEGRVRSAVSSGVQIKSGPSSASGTFSPQAGRRRIKSYGTRPSLAPRSREKEHQGRNHARLPFSP